MRRFGGGGESEGGSGRRVWDPGVAGGPAAVGAGAAEWVAAAGFQSPSLFRSCLPRVIIAVLSSSYFLLQRLRCLHIFEGERERNCSLVAQCILFTAPSYRPRLPTLLH